MPPSSPTRGRRAGGTGAGRWPRCDDGPGCGGVSRRSSGVRCGRCGRCGSSNGGAGPPAALSCASTIRIVSASASLVTSTASPLGRTSRIVTRTSPTPLLTKCCRLSGSSGAGTGAGAGAGAGGGVGAGAAVEPLGAAERLGRGVSQASQTSSPLGLLSVHISHVHIWGASLSAGAGSWRAGCSVCWLSMTSATAEPMSPSCFASSQRSSSSLWLSSPITARSCESSISCVCSTSTGKSCPR
mmetsp:Transcript_3325/g.8775  ORF Transcript_3325/g.8775 Transcript_3325/m.8775 type:complete len:242 (-) Transcript_3325:137-862(-)